jgi:hypothetical protein
MRNLENKIFFHILLVRWHCHHLLEQYHPLDREPSIRIHKNSRKLFGIKKICTFNIARGPRHVRIVSAIVCKIEIK